MPKTSSELTQKAAGYLLAASNAAKRESNKKQVVTKTTITKTSK
jgi:hypothetical protein